MMATSIEDHSIITSNEFSSDENTYIDMDEWLDDIFDIFDDDDDDHEGCQKAGMTGQDGTILQEYYEDFDFNSMHTYLDDEEMVVTVTEKDLESKAGVQEEVLSQKLSQLSTTVQNEETLLTEQHGLKRTLSTTFTPETTMTWKKIRVWDDENKQQEDISDYCERLNKLFDQIMMKHVIPVLTTMSLEDLRDLAILKHKIQAVHLRQQLWNTYLKAGQGQYETPTTKTTTVNRCVWSRSIRNNLSTKSNKSNLNEVKDDTILCHQMALEKLQDLYEMFQKYQCEYQTKKTGFTEYTEEIEAIINAFIGEYSLVPSQMKLDYKLTLFEYEYEDQILVREYFQQQPTKEQIQIGTRLYDLRFKYVKSKYELIELKQRILCNKPTKILCAQALSLVSTSKEQPSNDIQRYQQQIDRDEKELQVKMVDLMVESIAEAERKILHCNQELVKEIDMVMNPKTNTTTHGFTDTLITLTNQRFNILNKRLDYISKFRINYFLRHQYDDAENAIDIAPLTKFCFAPTMIMGTALHLLTETQLKLLNRGPTYVPPYQMHTLTLASPSANISLEELLQKEFKLLQHHLTSLFTKQDVNIARRMFLTREIKEDYINSFSITLPSSLQQRGFYEKQLLESIQTHLKRNHLILRRTANQRNMFYLGYKSDFENQIEKYFEETDAFEICEIIHEENLQKTQDYLIQEAKLLNADFNANFPNKKQQDILNRILITIEKLQLPYLYFLPNISYHEDHLITSVLPIIAAVQHSATFRLAQFLDQVLRSSVEIFLQSTLFQNEADFIRKLNQYIEKDKGKYFRANTHFVTMKILNYSTMASHDHLLEALKRFLQTTLGVPYINNISSTKIYYLTFLFLHNNRFYYNNKIYRFVKGGPLSFPFMELLNHIYLYDWQRAFLKHPFMQVEFYGRCQDQILFTWNGSKKELNELLKLIEPSAMSIELDIHMGHRVAYLNASIENQNGTFYSCVNHDRLLEKYTLPYALNNSKAAHSHWLRSSLIRAVRYCTSVHDFAKERIYLEVTCLANGYSIDFIEKRIQHFFKQFDATSLRYSLDQTEYNRLRLRLFNFISEQQRHINENQDLKTKNQLVQLTYVYEYGSKHKFNEELNKKISDLLYPPDRSKAAYQKPKIIINTKHQHSLNALLSEQKPYHRLLKNN